MNRLCAFCGTPLSMYNTGEFCYAHTPGTVVFEFIERNKCVAAPSAYGMQGTPTVPEISSPEYVQMAFKRVAVGQINTDHQLERF